VEQKVTDGKKDEFYFKDRKNESTEGEGRKGRKKAWLGNEKKGGKKAS